MADKGNLDHDHDTQQQGCACQGESRRKALGKLGAGLLGAAGLAAISGCPGGSTYGKEGHGARPTAAIRNESGLLEMPKRDVRIGTAVEITISGEKAYIIQHRDATRTPEERWRAISRICTHNKCLVGFAADKWEFHCPCHGSKYDYDGTPIAGPARRPLKRWKIEETGENVVIHPSEVL